MTGIMFYTAVNSLLCYVESIIAQFFAENKIATICCVDANNMPHCFHCFYVFDETHHLLYFKSSANTLHSQLLLQNPAIAGSILPEKAEFISLKGIQLTGSILYPDSPGYIDGSRLYHKRFIFALAMPGQIWCIQLHSVKMTDNTKVFGKKLKWDKHQVA